MPFVNGQYMVTPGSAVILNDNNLLAPPSTPGLGLLLIGPATDGQPNTPITISSPQEAINKLKGGDLLQACLLAFNPSREVQGVNSLTVIRPEQATPATSTIGTVINLTTTSYGVQANLAKWMVQAGTTSGYKVSLGFDFVGPGGQTYPTVTQDNVGLNVLSIYYTGTGTTPTVTVTDSSLTLTVTSGTGGTINFTNTMTVQQLVNQINAISGWMATVLDPNANDLVQALFDNVSSKAVGTTAATATVLTANVTAVVRWINSTGSYFTATRQANAATVPTFSGWTYATGGTTPTASNSDWQNAYTTAQGVTGIAIVCPVNSSSSIWAMNDAHCAYMTGLGQWRRGYVGDALGQTLTTEITNAAVLNSQYTSVVWPGSKGVDYNGNNTTFAPYLVACQIAGARAGNPPPGKITNTSIISQGLETALTPAQVAQANAAGIACLRTTQQGTVVLSWDRTTWIQDTKYDKVENLTGLAAGMIVQTQNAVLRKYVGRPVTPQLLGHIQGDLLADLTNWYQAGLLAVAPKLADINVTANGQVITASASVAIIVPGNYIVLTLNAYAYSGAAA